MANDFDLAVQKLNDPKQGVRETGLWALSELGTEAAVDFIGEKVIADRSKNVRLLATNLLANIGGEKAVVFLMKALKDPEGEIRKTAIDALVCCKNLDSETETRLLDVIKERLESSDKDERLEALTELSNFKTAEIIDLIGNKMLKDRSRFIKEKAAAVLAFEFGGEEVKDWMLRVLSSKNSEIQLIAVKYLGTVADGKLCKNILLPLLENDSDEIKTSAVTALCNRYSKLDEETGAKYITFLENNIESNVSEISGFSIRALLIINPKNYIERFIDRLSSFDELPNILGRKDGWLKSDFEVRHFPSLIETLLSYADSTQLERIVNILPFQFEDGFLSSRKSIGTTILNSFFQSPRAAEIFAIIRQNLLQTTCNIEKTVWVSSLAYLVQSHKNDPANDENMRQTQWAVENFNPTIELFKEIIKKQDKVRLRTDWRYFTSFLHWHKQNIGKYQYVRNDLCRYLTPWLQLYGVNTDDLNVLPVTSKKRKTERQPLRKKAASKFIEPEIMGHFKMPVIKENIKDRSMTPEAIAESGEQLLTAGKKDDRLSVLSRLIAVESEQVYRYMLMATDDRSADVREEAWQYIARFDTDETYHNMLTAAKSRDIATKLLALDFLLKYPEKDSADVLEESIDNLAELIMKEQAIYWYTYYLGTMLSLFNRIAAVIVPKTMKIETAENLFHYLKKSNSSEGFDSDHLSIHYELMFHHIYPLITPKLFPEMEEIIAEIFIKGKMTSHPFDTNRCLQPLICMAAGKAKQTERFFDLLADKIRSGSNFEKAMGAMSLIALVDSGNPDFENWNIHLNEVIDLFSGLLAQRKDLPTYRGSDDERQTCQYIGIYKSGLWLGVSAAVEKSKKQIKTPKKHDIFERNLIPWLEAKKM